MTRRRDRPEEGQHRGSTVNVASAPLPGRRRPAPVSALAPSLILDAVREMAVHERAELRALLSAEDYAESSQQVAAEFLTVAEAASHVRSHAETIRRAIRAGSLPANRVGSSWRIRQTDLDSWINQTPSECLRHTGARRRRQTQKHDAVAGAWAGLR